MGIESFFAIVIMVTLAIISATLVLVSLVGTLIKYREMRKENEPIELNPNMMFFSMFVPLVYLTTLGFMFYMF